MEVRQALQKTTNQLKNLKNPALEAEILLSHILKKNREFLFTYPGKELTEAQFKNYKKLAVRRLKGEPVAYLTGQKEFYGLNFFVNKNVLIPRPETELMVEEAVELITCLAGRQAHNKCITLIDVGTGSGCIAITLSKILESKLPITNYKLLAIDISKLALAIAKKNAKFHVINKRIKFIHGDLLKPVILNSKFLNHNSKLIILANLPYGWKEWKNNCSMETAGLKFEPDIALFAEKKGLKLYEDLFEQIIELTKFKPLSLNLFCEFDPRQTSLMRKLIKKYFPSAKLQIKKDLAGRNRLAIIKIFS